MRIGNKIVIIIGVSLFVFVVILMRFDEIFSIDPTVKLDEKISTNDSESLIFNEMTDIPPELKNVVESLSSLEQELNETNGNDLGKQIKKADVMIEEMDKLISESNSDFIDKHK